MLSLTEDRGWQVAVNRVYNVAGPMKHDSL